MARAVTMTEARARLGDLDRRLHENPEEGAVAVTRRGKPRLAVMSWERYESMVETDEVLADPQLLADIRESLGQADEGQVLTSEEVRLRAAL